MAVHDTVLSRLHRSCQAANADERKGQKRGWVVRDNFFVRDRYFDALLDLHGNLDLSLDNFIDVHRHIHVRDLFHRNFNFHILDVVDVLANLDAFLLFELIGDALHVSFEQRHRQPAPCRRRRRQIPTL